jgi:hypothetical protein
MCSDSVSEKPPEGEGQDKLRAITVKRDAAAVAVGCECARRLLRPARVQPKSEFRIPKEGRNLKPEHQQQGAMRQPIRDSTFAFHSDFGIRVSDLMTTTSTDGWSKATYSTSRRSTAIGRDTLCPASEHNQSAVSRQFTPSLSTSPPKLPI